MAKVEANKIMVGPPCIPSCTHNDTGIEGKAVIPSIMHQLVDEERMGSVAELSNQALWPSTFYLVSNCIQWHQYQSTDNFIKWMHAICISTHTRKCYPACVLCIHSSPSYAFCANFMLLIYNAKVLQCTTTFYRISSALSYCLCCPPLDVFCYVNVFTSSTLTMQSFTPRRLTTNQA